MGIEDIQISEELETNAPSIKYRGNEGPKSPQEMEKMMMADLEEEYLKYVDDMMEQGIEPMTLEQFLDQAMAEGQMSKGPILPSDEDPINPFQPKPQGPVLPDRQMAAYGGIMGVDGRKQYGIGSWFQKAKDKFVDDIIPNEIKENPLLTAALVAGGNELLPGGADRRNSVIDFILGEKTQAGEKGITREGGVLQPVRNVLGTRTGENRTVGGDILGSISKNIVPIVGGIGAGLFTKGGGQDMGGVPSDDTALNLAEYKKAANLLDQKQGLAADMNFLPTVASRKYSPEEMAVTYAQAAATGGRIGYNEGNSVVDYESDPNYQGWKMIYETNPDAASMNENHKIYENYYMSKQNMKAEGGIMDLGGMEKDYRAEGGFVPIGREEKADDVPARLSVNEFVFTADAVRNAGGGDIDQGAKVMENMMKHLEQGGQVSEESQGMAGARDMFETSERLSEVI